MPLCQSLGIHILFNLESVYAYECQGPAPDVCFAHLAKITELLKVGPSFESENHSCLSHMVRRQLFTKMYERGVCNVLHTVLAVMEIISLTDAFLPSSPFFSMKSGFPIVYKARCEHTGHFCPYLSLPRLFWCLYGPLPIESL